MGPSLKVPLKWKQLDVSHMHLRIGFTGKIQSCIVQRFNTFHINTSIPEP